NGMVTRGYDPAFAARCFSQIQGFGEYGFPESHAASFGNQVYVSCWMKCYYPDVFAAALLNSQPMGFYAPAQIVRDAREHGVEIRPVDVNFSDWDCTLEPLGDDKRMALRLGLRQIKGLSEADAERLVAARGASRREQGSRLSDDASEICQGYRDARDLWRRSGLGRAALERLAAADALRSLDQSHGGLDRRRGLWALKALGAPPLPLFATDPAVIPGRREAASPEPKNTDDKAGSTDSAIHSDGRCSWVPGSLAALGPRNDTVRDADGHAAALLPEMPLGEHVVEDYATLGLTIKRHPLAFLRAELKQEGLACARDLATLPVGRRLAIAGLVLI